VADDGPCVADGAWVTIEAGRYVMGSPGGGSGWIHTEFQQHVTLTNDFAILSTEVTQGQFEARMGYNPSSFVSCGPGCPVESLTWHEAAAYCNSLSEASGWAACYECTGSGRDVACEYARPGWSPYECSGYRLPQEAEWEYAARAGTTTSTYNGDLASGFRSCEQGSTVLDPIAWYCGNSAVEYAGAYDLSRAAGKGFAGTHPVGLKRPNAWGLLDMLGNVSEWTNDCFRIPPEQTVTNPHCTSHAPDRTIRGGSWFWPVADVRAAVRTGVQTFEHSDAIGFRPVRTVTR
jgi:formylglycine-generating enzyme required for sulfatase activity